MGSETTEAIQRSLLRAPRLTRWTVAGAVLLVLVGLSLLRQAGAASWNTLYAEDGFVFLRESIVDGLGAFTTTYVEYIHTLPRILALPESVLPVSWAAAYSAVAAAFVVGACALVQFHVTRDVIRSAPLRAMLAASVVLAPVTIIETLNNLACMFWILSATCFWVLLIPPRSRVDTAAASSVAFLAMASQPLNAVFAPLAVIAWTRDRNRRTTTVLIAVAAGLVLQIVGVTSVSGNGLHLGSQELESLARGYGLRVVGAVWLGEPWLKSAWLEVGSALVVIAVLGTAIVVAVLFARCERSARVTALAALVFSALAAFATMLGRGGVIHSPGSGQWSVVGTRYVVVPLLLFLGAIVILVDRATFSPPRARMLRTGVVIWLIVLAAVGFRASNFRSDGPEWARAVHAARRDCAGRPADSEVTLPITPAGLAFNLPCRELR